MTRCFRFFSIREKDEEEEEWREVTRDCFSIGIDLSCDDDFCSLHHAIGLGKLDPVDPSVFSLHCPVNRCYYSFSFVFFFPLPERNRSFIQQADGTELLFFFCCCCCFRFCCCCYSCVPIPSRREVTHCIDSLVWRMRDEFIYKGS